MKKNDYVISIKKNTKLIYEERSDRLCQAIKKFVGYCVSNRWVKKSTLIGYFIRHRIITRYELGTYFFDPDIGKDKSTIKKK